MNFVLSFEIADDPEYPNDARMEAFGILHGLASKFAQGAPGDGGPVLSTNGNTVGEWRVR